MDVFVQAISFWGLRLVNIIIFTYIYSFII